VILGPDEPWVAILLWAGLWIALVSFCIRSYSPFVLSQAASSQPACALLSRAYPPPTSFD
jgi:hypothetical protein